MASYQEKGWFRQDRSMPGGTQGDTHRARRSDGTPDQFPYVLKIPAKQAHESRHRSRQRRARLAVEAATLEKLDHDGIARFVDSNHADWRENRDADIFIVTEYVEGISLRQLVETRGPLSLRDAVQLAIAILKAVDYLATMRVVHRDIKPEHVLLPNGDILRPKLIDFGLCYDWDEGENHNTAPPERVGNAFLRLPEHAAGDAHDPRSDVTQCVGLFHHMLTGRTPDRLRLCGKAPHERIPIDTASLGLNDWQVRQLRRILDTGYAEHPSQRWQSARLLIPELGILLEDAPPERRFEDEMTRMSVDLVQSITGQQAIAFRDSITLLEKHVIGLIHKANSGNMSTYAHLSSIPGGVQQHPNGECKKTVMARSLLNSAGTVITFSIQRSSDELVYSASRKGGTFHPQFGITTPAEVGEQRSEPIRIGLLDPELSQRLKRLIDETITDTIADIAIV
jgi:serine/threonine-protein kinase